MKLLDLTQPRAQGVNDVQRAGPPGHSRALSPLLSPMLRGMDSVKRASRAGRRKVGPTLERRWRKIRQSRLLRPLAALAFLGPGLIAGFAGNDAGGITTYAAVGAQYGYGLLWMLIPVGIALAVVQEMVARMGAATNQGLSDMVRERFGVRGAAFAMLTLFIANALITISEFAGIAAASELLGIPKLLTVPLAVVGLWLLISRGSYGRIEKVFLAMALAFLAYPIAAFVARPDWGQVALQTVRPSFQLTSAYLFLFVGTVGTTITPYMQLYLQSSVAEKRIPLEDYPHERSETYLGTVLAMMVSAFVVIATGATVFVASGGAGVRLETASQAAEALVPVAGQYAELLFAIGLIGASLLAAAVVPLSTSYAVCESFGFERGVSRSFREAPIFHGLFAGLLVVGALVALVIPNGLLVTLIIIAQVINGVLLPILLVFILLLVNDRRIMGSMVNKRAQNIIAITTAVILTALSLAMIASVILPPLGVPFLQ
ncbi:MAG TPA: Nramp family divalent metal transporter [Ktedonobacterales bacterium]|nr:Nramp family divalent metal transporter [Ktedonobacterales bacterium]